MNSTHRRSAAGILAFTALVASAAFAPVAQGADAAAGRKKAQHCAACHGPIGISQLPNAPHLAGQPEFYLVEQLKAYRAGRRVNDVMNVAAKPLTDADINDLVAWYASIKIEAKPPAE
jgi:cytochrome c553